MCREKLNAEYKLPVAFNFSAPQPLPPEQKTGRNTAASVNARLSYLATMLALLKQSLLHLLFPHVCEGCGSDALPADQPVCIRCSAALPQTHFSRYAGNPAEKIFWGRLPLEAAATQYYFTKESLVQRLMHNFKYRGNKELGLYLGRQTGISLKESGRFDTVDALVPLPLFSSKERKRGFNQATVLCNGIAEALGKPVWTDVVSRTVYTETQTKKNRTERWQNMEGRFSLDKPQKISGRHILLVDDIMTTGATLEACGRALLAGENVRLSIAALCNSSKG